MVGGLAFIYLLVPIAYIFVFSFNDAGRTNLEWRGFTLDNWQNPCGAPAVCESLVHSLQVGTVATIVATALGTLIAIGLVRYKFRFRKITDVLIILPLATPEVVLGASLLAQFLNLGWELGYTTIVIAHIVFCMSFVIVTVRARVSSWIRGLKKLPPISTPHRRWLSGRSPSRCCCLALWLRRCCRSR